MSKRLKNGRDGLSEQQTQNPTAISLAAARTGQRSDRADGGQEVAEPWASGAPPTNRAPDNSNPEDISFKALRWGVDSLYLSYPGELSKEVESQLLALKELAQSSNPDDVGKAQFALGSHVFEVKEKGAKLFPFILEDGAFRIQLARPGKKTPMAYVKVSAHYLAHVGPVAAEKHLYELLSELGEIHESANVSRIDLYVDFQTSADMEGWDRHAWVTRASGINAYAVSGEFSGWSIGLGGDISARLYNKLLEIISSNKAWVIPLWQKSGWDGSGLIWRLEFELKRNVLTQKDLSKLAEVLNHQNGLWSYATTEWLRLTIPNEADQTRSRWPIHPLWGFLSSVDWESHGGPLAKRFSPTRSPNDDKLIQIAFSTVLSYMAKHGFEGKEFYEGTEDFLAAIYAFYDQKAHDQGMSYDDFIAEKLALKRRQFNTVMNDPAWAERHQANELAKAERAYRKESDGN